MSRHVSLVASIRSHARIENKWRNFGDLNMFLVFRSVFAVHEHRATEVFCRLMDLK